MREVVIVASWRRAEYLSKSLDALYNARGVQDKEVWVFQNNRRDVEVDLTQVHQVLRNQSRFHNFRVMSCEYYDILPAGKGSEFLFYAAYEDAYESNAPKAYFIQDDCVITPDFFEWHEAVQADGNWFASSAWRQDQGQTKPYDLEAYYQISYPNEISMGMCVKHDSLRQILQYYPSYTTEVMKEWSVVMPYVQRCYHIGQQSSVLGSGINTGGAIDILPDPIPDYGQQRVILK